MPKGLNLVRCGTRNMFGLVHGLLVVGQFAVGQFVVKKMLVSVILG